ncbi:DUF5635 domain-containing protein [Kineococcus sp. LSe6-4]|uniref:DUF5635 domain-containing protein n=1 Tax=Kineococcus halophytocola TaxID=3234027 RepID=A0ABV4H3D1_9ACTN
MIPDPVEARRRTREHAEAVLTALARGEAPPQWESQAVDLKEEAGRRDEHGDVQPGQARNPQAEKHLAAEVRCFANTPGGGAVVLGVDDKTHDLLGTALDADFLRQRLHVLTGVAPVVEERSVRGVRVLLLLVGEADGPVEDSDHRLRWRVGDRCVTVDRAEWWTRRAARIGVDPMAAVTSRRLADVRESALTAVRAYLVEGGDTEAADLDGEALLTRIGVLRPDGSLSQAGVVVLCPQPRACLELSRLDVAGGDVTAAHVPVPGSSLLEGLREVEARLDAMNDVRPVSRGLVEEARRALPPRAVREAVLNGLTHRDWFHAGATTVRWIDADDTLEVTSPGGFTGGVNPTNALTTRHPRYPALADLFQALRLVDRQGVGVPRMYQTMLAGGHHAPVLEERPGPAVRTTLPGKPLVPVLPEVLAAVEPLVRRRDVRVAVLLDALLRHPFLTLERAAAVLQQSVDAARVTLQVVTECRVGDLPVFQGFRDTTVLADGLLEVVRAGRFGHAENGDVLWYRRSGLDTVRRVAHEWLGAHDRVTSGDVARLTGTWQANASKSLSVLADASDTVRRGPGRGRAAHFVAVAAGDVEGEPVPES